jgi:hypothetical protein
MDIMRQIQQEEIAPRSAGDKAAADTELDSKVND